MTEPTELLTRLEVADRLRMSLDFVKAHLDEFEEVRFGRTSFITGASVESYIERSRVPRDRHLRSVA